MLMQEKNKKYLDTAHSIIKFNTGWFLNFSRECVYMRKYAKKFKLLYEKVADIFEDAPGCHDWWHTMRVLHNARTIAKKEKKADYFVVELGALLHDVSRPDEFNSRGKLCHAEHGSLKAADLLAECGFDDKELIGKVTECVRKHRFRIRGNANPESIEEKIVYDADKLDSIGAIGVGRAFHFAGRIGAKLHNTKKEALASKSYSREDTAYREFLVKLRRIKSRMQTRGGKELARKRHDFMRKYFEELNKEIYESR